MVNLRVPNRENGDKEDALRRESEREAADIDARRVEIWGAHPRRVFVDSNADFFRKAQRALAIIRAEMTCCASKDARSL